MRMNESTPGYKYIDRIFIVDGKGTNLHDTMWVSNSPGSGYTVPITDWKKPISNHPDKVNETYFIDLFEKWKATNKPLKSKKQNYGIIEIYEIPVYPYSRQKPAGWNTSMATYDIYNINTHTNQGVHVPENEIVKPIKMAYLIYSQQKHIFIHLFQTKREAMGWYNSTSVTESVQSNMKYIKTFEAYISDLNEREFTPEERETLAKSGDALPDGSFPIENEEDLKNAIHAYGRSKNQSAAAKHIAKRAKELGLDDLLPDTSDFQKSLKA